MNWLCGGTCAGDGAQKVGEDRKELMEEGKYTRGNMRRNMTEGGGGGEGGNGVLDNI